MPARIDRDVAGDRFSRSSRDRSDDFDERPSDESCRPAQRTVLAIDPEDFEPRAMRAWKARPKAQSIALAKL
jgi:hypothetical protein